MEFLFFIKNWRSTEAPFGLGIEKESLIGTKKKNPRSRYFPQSKLTGSSPFLSYALEPGEKSRVLTTLINFILGLFTGTLNPVFKVPGPKHFKKRGV